MISLGSVSHTESKNMSHVICIMPVCSDLTDISLQEAVQFFNACPHCIVKGTMPVDYIHTNLSKVQSLHITPANLPIQ